MRRVAEGDPTGDGACPGQCVLFLVNKNPDAAEAIPSGIALSIAKQIIVKAGEDFVLQ